MHWEQNERTEFAHSEQMVMNPEGQRRDASMRGVLVILCAVMLAAGSTMMQMGSARAADAAPLIPPDQLDSLVAPIALYPDPLLTQTLAASTYILLRSSNCSSF